MKSQEFVIHAFREKCHDKVRGIEAFIAEHENVGLTFDKLEELEELNTALEEQWSHMEAAWDEAMVSIEDGSIFTELDELVTATGKVVGGVLETSEQFIKENLVQVLDAGASPAGATPAVVPEDDHEVCEEDVGEEDVRKVHDVREVHDVCEVHEIHEV